MVLYVSLKSKAPRPVYKLHTKTNERERGRSHHILTFEPHSAHFFIPSQHKLLIFEIKMAENLDGRTFPPPLVNQAKYQINLDANDK